MPSCENMLRLRSLPAREALCEACVYFSRNLNPVEYPVLIEHPERCGLGFRPGDAGCSEMRTDNCRVRSTR